MANNIFKIGDVVRHRRASTPMTVEGCIFFDEENKKFPSDIIKCAWFDNFDLRRDKFHSDDLIKTEPLCPPLILPKSIEQ